MDASICSSGRRSGRVRDAATTTTPRSWSNAAAACRKSSDSNPSTRCDTYTRYDDELVLLSRALKSRHKPTSSSARNRQQQQHPLNGPLSGTTRVSWYQKGRTNLDFTEARDSEWQWHQLGYTQVCTQLQTDNHTSTPPLSSFTGRMPFLPPNQQRQSTEGKIYRTEPTTK